MSDSLILEKPSQWLVMLFIGQQPIGAQYGNIELKIHSWNEKITFSFEIYQVMIKSVNRFISDTGRTRTKNLRKQNAKSGHLE